MNAIEEKAAGLSYAQSEIDDILALCMNSTKLFGQVFLPERFHLTFSPGHDEIFEALDSDAPFVCITAPRNFGKSTLKLAYMLKLLCLRESNLLAMVSHTADQAIRDGEDVKTELLTNENILAVWGSLKPDKTDFTISRNEEFSKESWKTNAAWEDGRVAHGGTLVLPRGWGQQVRGIKHGRFRFDKIFSDDVEGTEAVLSEDQRAKLKQWFYADVIPSVQQAHKKAPGEFPWKIIVIGTLLHEASLLSELRENPDWISVHVELCNDALESTWEDFKTTESIKELYDRYERAEMLDVFDREFRGIPISEKTRKFKKSFFSYYEEQDLKGKPALESIVIVDPARTTEEKSCDTAIICWTFDPIGGFLYQRDLIVAKLEPDVIYREAAEMAKRYRATTVAIESTGLGEFLVQPFKLFVSHWGYNFEFVEVKSRGMKNEKINRIASLLPYYRQGRIKHNRANCTILEQQLLNFPHSKRLDAMDAAAYIVELMELGDRFFVPQAQDPKAPGFQSDEDKFAELEKTYAKPLSVPDPAEIARFTRYRVA